MKIKKFDESIDSEIDKVKGFDITYFELFPLLKGLEKARPGIKKRVWDFLCEDHYDDRFEPIQGRILNINLFYFGVGDEYELEYIKKYPKEIEHWKKIHPENFIKDSKEFELRLDFNFIWYIYEKEIKDVEAFPVLIDW